MCMGSLSPSTRLPIGGSHITTAPLGEEWHHLQCFPWSGVPSSMGRGLCLTQPQPSLSAVFHSHQSFFFFLIFYLLI